MENFKKQVKVAAIGGAIVFASAGIGTAAAADVPVPEAELEAPSPEYDRPPPSYHGQEPGESYMPPPRVYGYPPPPPRAYSSYGPPPGVILPEPYYLRPHYRLGYALGPYGVRRYGPPIAGIYGRYGHGAYRRGYPRW